ncbi:MAG: biotin--[acetyl-CoA-carboxylase] ligase [Flavobacteriales bacterium]|nr:biotin--[acetyl-CoA-carboxylase] ligase [Flavobacteriales bacterium]
MDRLSQAIGVTLIELPSVESTNRTIAGMAVRSELPHGAVLLAHEQTAGRGQRGRQWISAAGLDLTFSLLLRPQDMRADEQFIIAQVAALAVHDTLVGHVPGAVRIKWPNDVLVERRKVAGILIENELIGDRVGQSIVGIGLNVNSRDLDAGLHATSMCLETGGTLDRMAVFGQLMEHLRRRYAQGKEAPARLRADYAERLWARGRWADMLLDGQPASLRPMDVDGLGRLLVEHPDGSVRAHGLDRLRFAPFQGGMAVP